ncbi:MAG: hypothetical protein J7647_26805 [Cyanobacteria bacterium SBLK]|nr:hypothetical protein [Cyanobacteria bacterium SBLK]
MIYGKREEIEGSQIRPQRKSRLAYSDELIMSYDRLKPSYDKNHYFCGKRTANGYKMISFPEYLYLYPDITKDMYLFSNKEQSIQQNKKISQERKDFLIKRLEYWMDWVKSGATGTIISSDRE